MLHSIFRLLFPAIPIDLGPHAQEITAQGIDLLYRSLFSAIVTFSLVPAATLWLMWPHIDHTILMVWGVLAYTQNAISIIVMRLYLQRPRSVAEAPKWGRFMTYLTLAQGIIWGSTCLLFFVPESAPLQVYVYIVLLTLSVGPVVIFAWWIESYYAMVIPSLTMITISFYLAEDIAYKGLMVGMIPTIAGLFHVAQNMRASALAALRLRFENQKLVEQLREEKEKAETASRDKTRFLASASHDLRQPVHALTLFVHALQVELKDERPRTLLNDMGRSIEALNQLLTSLLDISKLDANIVKPNVTYFELQRLADVLQAEYAPQALAKGLQYYVHVESSLVAHSDQALLETMLRNLVSNALRYTHEGSIDVRFFQQGEDIWAEVCDTGVGIDKHQHEDIFREFFQVTNPERDRTKGLGLGLAIIKRLASLLNHRIEMNSQLGVGSCFTVILPAGDRDAIPPDTLAPFMAKRDIDGMRVLVIDDEVAVREGMFAVLSGWGCEVIMAGSEEEALEKTQNGPVPHVIVSDYRLREDKTGAQAIEALRARFGSAIPALIITGDTAPERLQEAQASGNALMHKPVPPVKLRAYLRNVQRRKA